jgi:hypothetical protein
MRLSVAIVHWWVPLSTLGALGCGVDPATEVSEGPRAGAVAIRARLVDDCGSDPSCVGADIGSGTNSTVDAAVLTGTPDAGPCVPTTTCASMGITCGVFTDDCGEDVDCGSCGPTDGGVVTVHDAGIDAGDAGPPRVPWLMWGDRESCYLPCTGNDPAATYYSMVPSPVEPTDPSHVGGRDSSFGDSPSNEEDPGIVRIGDQVAFCNFVTTASDDELRVRVYITEDTNENLTCLFFLTPTCDPPDGGPSQGPRDFELVLGREPGPSCGVAIARASRAPTQLAARATEASEAADGQAGCAWAGGAGGASRGTAWVLLAIVGLGRVVTAAWRQVRHRR